MLATDAVESGRRLEKRGMELVACFVLILWVFLGKIGGKYLAHIRCLSKLDKDSFSFGMVQPSCRAWSLET